MVALRNLSPEERIAMLELKCLERKMAIDRLKTALHVASRALEEHGDWRWQPLRALAEETF